MGAGRCGARPTAVSRAARADRRRSGTDGRTGDEDRARAEGECPEEERAGLPDQAAEGRLESVAERSAAVASEQREDAEGKKHDPGPKGLHVDEARAGDHQASHADEGKWQGEASGTHGVCKGVVHVLADDAAVPAEEENGREKEAGAGEAEPDQLGMRGRMLDP